MRRGIAGIGILGCCLMVGMGEGCFVDINDIDPLPPEPGLSYETGGAGQGGSGAAGNGKPIPCKQSFAIDKGAELYFFADNLAPGSCYVWVDLLSDSDMPTWEEAEKICVHNDMHLATITTEEERRLIDEHMTKNDDQRAWIGGRYDNGSGWTWADGQPWLIRPCNTEDSNCKDTVDLWDSGQPDDVGTALVCIRMRDEKTPSTPSRFRDGDCSGRYNFICEQSFKN